MPTRTEPSFQLKDADLLRQQAYIDGQWVEGGRGEQRDEQDEHPDRRAERSRDIEVRAGARRDDDDQLGNGAALGLAYCARDSFPVSPGHALVIPLRHCASFFDLSAEELAVTREAFRAILNGEAAGVERLVTAFHLPLTVVNAAALAVPRIDLGEGSGTLRRNEGTERCWPWQKLMVFAVVSVKG